MRNHILPLMFIALITSFSPIAKAEVADGTIVDPAIVAPLMAWVEQATGTKVPVLPQVIASRDQFDLVLERMGGSFAGRPQSAYIPGTVYLDNNSWDPSEPTQISLLVHELVHHAQLFMKAKWACPDAREEQAYTLQNRWLEQHGHEAFVNASWIERISACEDGQGSALLAQEP